VLTIEIVGEFLGIDAEKGLYTYFRRHYGEWFPALKRVHRTTFTRQMANLWAMKRKFWRELLGRIGFDPEVSLIDSFPLPVCRFARAYRCRALAQESAFRLRRDEQADLLYGLRAHLHVAWPGVIVGVDLAPADVHELHLAEELLQETKGWALWGTETIGVLSSPSDSRTKACVCWLPTSPRKGKWCLVAVVVDAKERPDRDGNLSAGRALWGQEGVGAGSLASYLSVATQGIEPYCGRIPFSASRAAAATFCGSPHRLNLHIG
jgi:hypothetical protein